MKRVLFLLFAVLILSVSAAAVDFDGYIVKIRQPEDTIMTLGTDSQIPAGENLYLVQTAEEVAALEKEGLVIYAEPNYILQTLDAPNDTYYSSQWTIPAAGFTSLYGTAYDGTGVTVAVIDSGLDTSHEDMAGVKISPYSKNFLGDGTHSTDYTRDQEGHGTFVISQIAAVTGNGKGLAGTAPGVEIMVLRCATVAEGSDKFPYDDAYDAGSGSISRIASAIEYAADNGADVINISMGAALANGSTTLQNAANYAAGKGVIVVSSAGNLGTTALYYPASCENVISVASVNKSGTDYVRSYFSQYNSAVDVTAPGGNVMGIDIYPSSGVWYTDVSSTYRTDSGTSFSSPVVAAVAAVARQIDGDLTHDEFMELLEVTCVDLGDAGKDEAFGFGLVSAENVVRVLTSGSYPLQTAVRGQGVAFTGAWAQVLHLCDDGTYKTRTVTAKDGSILCSVAAKEMTDLLTVKVYDENGSLFTGGNVRICDAIKTAMAEETDADKKAGYVALLHYGAQAQSYFGYGTDRLADANVDSSLLDSLRQQVQYSDGSALFGNEPALICGTSLILGETPKLKFHFLLGEETVTVSDGTGTVTLGGSAGYYSHIVEADVFETVSITVRKDGKVAAVGADSIASYCSRLAETEPELAEAILIYGLSEQ